MKLLFDMFITFAKVGVMTFGGGYAMINLLDNEFVERKKWLGSEEFMNLVTVAESTPGPIAINSATFIGYKVCGVLGSALATLGVVLPSFVIIYAISFVLRQFQELEAVRYAFFGIRAGVLALLVKALWTMYQKSPKGWVSYVVMAGSFLLTAVFDFNVIFVIIGCAVFGLVTSLYLERRAGK